MLWNAYLYEKDTWKRKTRNGAILANSNTTGVPERRLSKKSSQRRKCQNKLLQTIAKLKPNKRTQK